MDIMTLSITIGPSIVAITVSIIALVKSSRNNKIVATTDILKSITDAKDIFEKSYNSYKRNIDEHVEKCIEKNDLKGISMLDEAIKIEFGNFVNRIDLGCFYYLNNYINKGAFQKMMYRMIDSMKLSEKREYDYFREEGFESVIKVWKEWSKNKTLKGLLNEKPNNSKEVNDVEEDSTCSS